MVLQGEEQDWREIVTYFSYPVKARDYSRWPDKPAGGGGAVQRAADGPGVQAPGRAIRGHGPRNGGAGQGLRGHGPEGGGQLLPEVPAAGPHAGAQAGTITLLLQDLVGGLQATRDGGRTWITVQPVEGAFVVNLGDHGHVRE